jgi:hypothetical protein
MRHRASTGKARQKSSGRPMISESLDYKHVAHGSILFKHNCDSFEAKHAERLADYPEGAGDPEEYAAQNMLWAPKEAHWLPCSTS